MTTLDRRGWLLRGLWAIDPDRSVRKQARR